MPSTNLSWRTFRPEEGYYTSEVKAPDRLPVRTFLPTGYEPNYPYPLLVFFHGQGGSEEQILRLAPKVSRRNYVCISLRGPQALDPRPDGRVGYSWGVSGHGDALVEEYALQAIEQTRRTYHIHSERIFLAGVCEGAAMAYRLGLRYPEKFGGVISLNGAMPRGGPILRFPQVRQLRVFMGHGIANPFIPLTTARRDFRLLYTAGLSVRLHSYLTTHRLHPDMLRDINRWIMDLCTAE
jgi:phospholipase/carboxylesterase